MEPQEYTQCRIHEDETGKRSRLNAMLRQKLQNLLPAGGDYSLVAGLHAARRDFVNDAGDSGGSPRIGIVVQGGKCMEEKGRLVHCGVAGCFVDGSGSSGLSYVTDAPYLSLSLGLNNRLVRRLMVEGKSSIRTGRPGLLLPEESVAAADASMVDAFLRLVRLVDRPDQVRFLAPLIIKEIHYRMLIGPLGEKVRTLHSRRTCDCSCGYTLERAFGWLFKRQWPRRE